MWASRVGAVQIVEFLLAHKATALDVVDEYGLNALMHSVFSMRLDNFRTVLKNVNCDLTDKEGNGIGHLAAITGNFEVLRVWVEDLGKKESRNDAGATPLHLADSAEMIEFLIVQEYDINSQDKRGWTALHYNLYLNKVQNVKILIQMGADLTVKDLSGSTLAEFASSHFPDLPADLYQELVKVPKLPALPASPALHALPSFPQPPKTPEHKSQVLLKSSQEIQEVNSEDDSVQTPSVVKPNLRKASSTDSNLQITPKLQMMLSEILMKTPNDAFSLQDFGVEEVKFSELKKRELIGQGAYGKVYRGYFRGSEVAIKEIDTEKNIEGRLTKEFIKEIECLLKIRHNRFLLLLAVCMEGPLCIVTELCKGGNLADAIDRKRLSREEKLKVALQIAEGIHYIHSKSPPIVHRDIKPQNILLDQFGQVKIADLGLSRAIEKVSNTEKVNSTRICAGTIRYMAPELYYEEPVCNRATDVWAFGCVLIHLFSENVPWTGLDLVAVQRRLILRQPLTCENVEPSLATLINSCCNIDPEARVTFIEIRSHLLDMLGVSNSQL